MAPSTTGDRILVGVCAAIWLVLIGVSVAAAVALIDLGRGFHEPAGNPHTSSVLYVIIVISALIIIGAIPVLLRARRTTRADPAALSGHITARAAAGPPIRAEYPPARGLAGQTERLTALRASSALPDAATDRVWLRGTVELATAMGVALVAVATATYLMAIGHQAAAWTLYVIAGVVTAAMPVIPWRHVRQLRRMLNEH